MRSPRGRGRWVGICELSVQNFEIRPTSHTVECRAKSPSGPERGMVSGALRAACAHAEEPGARHFDDRCRRHRCVARTRREDRVVACCRDPTSEDQAESTGGVDGSGDSVGRACPSPTRPWPFGDADVCSLPCAPTLLDEPPRAHAWHMAHGGLARMRRWCRDRSWLTHLFSVDSHLRANFRLLGK